MLKLRTGYSFRVASGTIEAAVERLKKIGAPYAPITDRASTFGFYRWNKAAEKAGLRPVFGVELAVTRRIGRGEKTKPKVDHWTFIAGETLGPLNRLVEIATAQFYYQPILELPQALAFPGAKITSHRPILNWSDPEEVEAFRAAGVFLPLSPAVPRAIVRRAQDAGLPLAATGENLFTNPEDFPFYETLVGRGSERTPYPAHILSREELIASLGALRLEPTIISGAFEASARIADGCKARIEKARLPDPPRPGTLREMCEEGARFLGCDLGRPEYRERLERELALIAAKEFEDYFYIVADVCRWARERMMVGPARGSSCGSLVCYLLRITTVDPIPHGLIFERFIDINRNDLPDIDIDFSDQRRHLVFEYITAKYGAANVARLGTVANFHPRSALSEAGGALNVPKYLTEAVADVLIERSSADSRALDTLSDTLDTTDAGRALMQAHPEMRIATRFEGHPRHYSQHAAGVVIASRPITDFVAIDARTGATMCDKKDAEDGYGLLKIDALGLTQLSVFEDALDFAGLPRDTLEKLPLDDQAAFDVLNNRRWAGIFQFNGLALQSVAGITTIRHFRDIVNITALARPGALATGGALSWANRNNGEEAITYPHPIFKPYLEETLGIVAYQEQVMNIGREIGGLSWEDVTALRKAMSKSLGAEFFNQYGDRWKAGAREKGIDEGILGKVWDDLCAYGSWSFNKSHSVAYGLVSYWCCWLKAHHPFEFAAATLSHLDDPAKIIPMLREMRREGFDYVPFHPEKSGEKWGFIDTPEGRKLLGPITGVRGIGPKTVASILSARARGERVPERAQKLLANGCTEYDSLSPIEDRIKAIMPNPHERNIFTRPTPIDQLTDTHAEHLTVMVFAIAEAIFPRDQNDPGMVAKRGGRLIEAANTIALNLRLRDDTGVLLAKIAHDRYPEIGRAIVERGRAGKAIYAMKGTLLAGRRFLMVEQVRYLGDMQS